MSRRLLIRTCVLLAVTSHAGCQYIDFISNLNAFLQPFTTTNDVTKRPETKHRQTHKQKYQDAIFFEDDDVTKHKDSSKTIDRFNIFPTTTKPRRKNAKTSTSHSNVFTTHSPDIRPININKLNKMIINHDVIRSINNNNRNPYNDDGYNNFNTNSETPNRGTSVYGYQGYNFDNNRRTTTNNYWNSRETTEYYNARQTTRRTTTGYNNERTTRRPSNNGGIYNSHTTRNPLLNRPGVKPAVVDHNLPPITNKPVTNVQRPTLRPVNTRPTYEDLPTKRPDTRPVNTRPPFENQNPIYSGVARPVPGDEPSGTEPVIEIGPDEDDMSESEKRRLYNICEQKCDEYKSARVKKVVALPLTPQSSPVEVNVSSCAKTPLSLIIGGKVASIETFPHMALVGWKKVQSEGYSWKCGGSLVSEQFVLTAGHCTYHDKDFNVVRYDGPPQAVQLGSSTYNDRSATVVQVAVVIRHPKYKLRRSYYDVALIKMVRTVTFSDTISPACLGVPPPVGEPVVATGWGKTEFGGDSSTELRSVSFPIWDMADCREIWGTSLKLPDGPLENNQVCAGERKGAKDTCQGDSGGPAQVQDGCAWRVVAVTSVGRSCGAPDTPALYARVPRAFIASQIFTNTKPSRDGKNQYGNDGANWGSENNNRSTDNNQYGSQGDNSRPNSREYNNGRVHNSDRVYNNGKTYSDNQGSSSDSSAVYNWSNNPQRYNNDWSAPGTTNNNNNRYNGNGFDQSNNGHNYAPTTTTIYSQNNYAQTGYNSANSFGQFGYNNDPSYSNPSVNYDAHYGYNDNGMPNNGYNGNNDNGYNNYQGRPWWNR